MKNLKITVNGVSYDVQVEEVGASSAVSAPVPAGAPIAAPVAAPAPAEAPAAPAATGSAGSVEVNSPMPGTILSVNVTVGQKITKGDVVAVLEAMKMENEIPAPQDGTVASINVEKGANVETGAVLITLS